MKTIQDIGGRPPYGYQYNDKEGNWDINNFERNNLIAIFQLALQKKSALEIAKELNIRGIKSQRGTRWSYQSVRYIFAPRRLEIYSGYLNKEKGSWPAIITNKQAKELTALMVIRPSESRTKKNEFLLSGLEITKCGFCDSKIKSTQSRTKNHNIKYYFCSSKSYFGKDSCPSKNRRMDIVDELVIKDIIIKGNTLKKYDDLLKKLRKENRNKNSSKALELRTKINKKLEQMTNAKSMANLEKYRAEISSLIEDEKNLIEQNIQNFDFESFGKEIKKFSTLSISEQKKLIGKYIQSIILYDNYLELTYPFPIKDNFSFTEQIEF